MIVVRGIGPIYWGLESAARADPKKVSKAWLVEIEPPFRKSICAVRVRVRDHAVHIGLCRRVPVDDGVDMIGRNLEADPQEIRTWWNGGENDAEEDSPAQP